MATKSECINFLGITVFSPDFGTKEFKNKYDKECSMYDEKEVECVRINSRLQSLIQYAGAKSLSPFDSERIDYTKSITSIRKEFDDKNCTQLIEKYRQSELGNVASKFSGLDKARIEEESKYVRNQRIFFGGLVLLGGVVIITMFGKKK